MQTQKLYLVSTCKIQLGFHFGKTEIKDDAETKPILENGKEEARVALAKDADEKKWLGVHFLPISRSTR